MRRRLTLAVLLLLLGGYGIASAQVAFDGTANISASFSAVSSVTLSAKTTDGVNRVAVIGAGSTEGDIDTVNYGASAATEVRREQGVSGPDAEVWRFVAPPTAATDVVITYLAAESGGAGVSSYTGVDQTTPVSNSAGANGSGSPATVAVTSAPGEMAVDAVGVAETTAPVVGAGQTQVWNTGPAFAFGAASYEAGAATVTMSWTFGAFPLWSIAALSLKEAGGGAAPPKRLLSLGAGD